jgi:methionyl-tRNA formyltransferase
MRVLFIGTGEIGVPVLRWLMESNEHEVIGVVTQPDKPVGRDQRIEAPPIKAALARGDVEILQPKRIRAEDAVGEIRALAPEVIVVMAYGQILPRAVLEIPRIACLNLHASLLPRHRGAAPIQAAIGAGDRETGISVMYMDEGLDTGDVLLQKRIQIADNETGGSLHDRLAVIAPVALEEALIALHNGTAPRIPQDNALATYAAKLEREHGRLDWNEPATVLERKIRAFDPWPGAYTVLQGDAGRERKLKIFRASVVDPCSADPANLVIPTKQGAIRLEEVQLEGKRRMSTAEFLRGYHERLVFA